MLVSRKWSALIHFITGMGTAGTHIVESLKEVVHRFMLILPTHQLSEPIVEQLLKRRLAGGGKRLSLLKQPVVSTDGDDLHAAKMFESRMAVNAWLPSG